MPTNLIAAHAAPVGRLRSVSEIFLAMLARIAEIDARNGSIEPFGL